GPVCCMNSRAKRRPPSSAGATVTGRTRPAIRAPAASMSEKVSTVMPSAYARAAEWVRRLGGLLGRSTAFQAEESPWIDQEIEVQVRNQGFAAVSVVLGQAEVDALRLLDEADADERDDAYDDHVDRDRDGRTGLGEQGLGDGRGEGAAEDRADRVADRDARVADLGGEHLRIHRRHRAVG